MKRLFVTTAVLLLFAVAVSAREAPVAGFGALSPDAPQETAQFDFLVGAWSCKTRNMRPDGTLHDGPDATWTGYYILDGWAIQDDWASFRPGGKPFRGTNIRSFNPRTSKWDNRWLPAGSLEWKYFESEQVGGTMVMTGGEAVDPAGRRFIDRNTFHQITDDSWKWRKDRSFNGAESWIEGVANIECRAAAGPAEAGDSARQAAQAIRSVLAQDSTLGKARNHAPESLPVAHAVGAYVAGLDAIDFTACPEAFTIAFRRHREAWHASLEFLDRHRDLRGEMHALFDQIRGVGGETTRQLEQLEKQIWDTWGEVEAVAGRHGALEPAD